MQRLLLTTTGLVLASLMVATLAAASSSKYLIESLPGLATPPKFKQYSGTLTTKDSVDKHDKHSFFWFVESQRSPSTDPVILWLNGGPGASSLIGFLTEHGPFRPIVSSSPAAIEPYEWSWNKISNILYLEQPISVGFSWSSSASDWTNVTDERVGADVSDFLSEWFKEFKEFQTNEFYLSGESYGGHYIPAVASELLRRRNSGDPSVPEISGLMIGNPATHCDWYFSAGDDSIATIDPWPFMATLRSFGFVGSVEYAKASKECGWNEGSTCDQLPGQPFFHNQDCVDAINAALYRWPVDNMDIYNLNAPVCLSTNGDGGDSAFSRHLTQFSSEKRKAHPKLTSGGECSKLTSGDESGGEYNPCLFNGMMNWLNRADVQKSLHVTKKTTWGPLSSVMSYNQDSMQSDATLHYLNWFKPGSGADSWRVLIFSGLTDAAVPFVGTEHWVRCLGRPIKQDWRSWTIDKQVAGLVVDYDRITLLSVRASGHTIPTYTPRPGYEFFARWIDNQPL